MDKELAMNINVLCQLFDFICASLIYSYRLGRNGSLHDMTLNRRWITSLGKVDHRPQDLTLLRLFLKPLANFLQQIYYESGGSGM